MVHSAGPKKMMRGGDLRQARLEGMFDDVRIGKNNTLCNTISAKCSRYLL